MSRLRNGCPLALLLCLVPALALAQQGGPDDLWEVTSKMEMAGMPFAMPAQTNRVCLQKGKQEEGVMPKDQNCRVEDMRRSGNRTTFRMVCEGKNRMTGTVDITSTGDSYQGSMQMQGTMEGQTMNMASTFSGKKVGSCTWVDPAAQQRATVAANCKKALDELSWFFFKDDQAFCKDYRGDFLRRVGQLAAEMRTAAKFDTWIRSRGDMQQLLQAGNQDPNAIWAAACDDGMATRNWQFVASYCERQAREIALQQCVGRRSTSAAVFEYAPICLKYPQQAGGQARPTAAPSAASPSQPAPVPAPVPQPPAAPPTSAGPPAGQPPAGALDKALDGLNRFKGLFGK